MKDGAAVVVDANGLVVKNASNQRTVEKPRSGPFFPFQSSRLRRESNGFFTYIEPFARPRQS